MAARHPPAVRYCRVSPRSAQLIDTFKLLDADAAQRLTQALEPVAGEARAPRGGRAPAGSSAGIAEGAPASPELDAFVRLLPVTVSRAVRPAIEPVTAWRPEPLPPSPRDRPSRSGSRRPLVVGGDAAGMSAAAEARRGDASLEIVVLERGPDVSYAACGLPYWIGGEIEEAERLVAHDRRVLPPPARHRRPHRGRGRRDRPRGAGRADRRTAARWATTTLVVATGRAGGAAGGPRASDAERASTCCGTWSRRAACSDAARAGHGSGGSSSWACGPIGLEMARGPGAAAGLPSRSRRGRSAPLARAGRRAGARGGGRRRGGRAGGGGARVRRVRGAGRPVARAGGRGDRCDLVLLGTGVEPRAELAARAGCRLGAGAARWRSTGAGGPASRGIWAAGDCATAWHRVLERDVWIPLATTATRQGRVAGRDVAGRPARFPGMLGAWVSRFGVGGFGATGLDEGGRAGPASARAPSTVRGGTARATSRARARWWSGWCGTSRPAGCSAPRPRVGRGRDAAAHPVASPRRRRPERARGGRGRPGVRAAAGAAARPGGAGRGGGGRRRALTGRGGAGRLARRPPRDRPLPWLADATAHRHRGPGRPSPAGPSPSRWCGRAPARARCRSPSGRSSPASATPSASTAAPGDPPPVRRPAERADPDREGRAPAAAALPRRVRADLARAASGACSASPSTRTTPATGASTSTTPTARATPGSSSTGVAATGPGRPRPAPGVLLAIAAALSRTTTAARWPSAPTATSTSAWATAAAAATRERNGQNARLAARQAAAHRRRRPRRQPPYGIPADNPFAARRRARPRSAPTGCATRGASRSTARPATSGSATSARTTYEEIDFRRARARAPASTSAGTPSRAARASRRRARAGPGATCRRWPSTPTPAAARSPAATSTAAPRVPALRGRYVFADYCTGRVWTMRPGRGPGGVREITGRLGRHAVA